MVSTKSRWLTKNKGYKYKIAENSTAAEKKIQNRTKQQEKTNGDNTSMQHSEGNRQIWLPKPKIADKNKMANNKVCLKKTIINATTVLKKYM